MLWMFVGLLRFLVLSLWVQRFKEMLAFVPQVLLDGCTLMHQIILRTIVMGLLGKLLALVAAGGEVAVAVQLAQREQQERLDQKDYSDLPAPLAQQAQL